MTPEKTYHIYTHANGSENLFRTGENYRYFLKRYETFTAGVVDTLVWCLMPNHLHLLVRVKSEAELKELFKNKIETDQTGLEVERKEDLSGLDNKTEIKRSNQTDFKVESNRNQFGLNEVERLTILQFSHLFNAYTKAYNKVYKRRGSLFIRAFKRKEITSDNYFTKVIHYIHTNPIKHGFTKSITEWPWSSYHQFLLPELTGTQQEVIGWFGGQQPFIEFHQQLPQSTQEFDMP